MRYDPILCMMVDDSVKTKDASKIRGFFVSQFGKKFHKDFENSDKMMEFVRSAKSVGTKFVGSTSVVDDSKTIDKAIKTCDILNIRESLKQDIKSGKITIKQAAIEMYEAGMFNWIPDENEVKRKLGL